MESPKEYWAELAQSWFDCNRANDAEHGSVATREQVVAYDPDGARLLQEVFGDRPWRYVKPTHRSAPESAHLASFDREKAGGFQWPEDLQPLDQQGEVLEWLEPGGSPLAFSSDSDRATSVQFVDRRARPVFVHWLDFSGVRKLYAEVRPGKATLLNTFPGHVWVLAEREVLMAPKNRRNLAVWSGWGVPAWSRRSWSWPPGQRQASA